MGGLKTLSIDLGSSFGYAIGQDGVIVESGEVTLVADAGQAHPGHRWMKFQRWLSRYSDVNEILFEDVPRFESAAAARVYCGLLAVLQMFALGQGIRMCGLKPNQIKKDFTGWGNAKKEVVCEVAHRLGWKGGARDTEKCHNEADAIALLWVIYTRRGIEPGFLQ